MKEKNINIDATDIKRTIRKNFINNFMSINMIIEIKIDKSIKNITKLTWEKQKIEKKRKKVLI